MCSYMLVVVSNYTLKECISLLVVIQAFAKNYLPSCNRTLQCISYAVSECCKEHNLYVPADAVQSSMINLFKHVLGINLLDTPAKPNEFNRAVLNLETKNILTYEHEFDPQIEVRIEEQKSNVLHHSKSFDEVYIYQSKAMNGPCYYVLCKTFNGQDEQFACYDATTPLGPKRLRQPMQHVDDSLFTLYRVKVKPWSEETWSEDDIDDDIQMMELE